jgi:peptidyl-prolyl cis-trans isomerase SurA
VAISFRSDKRLLAALALMLMLWGAQPSDLAAQSECRPDTPNEEEAGTAAVVNGQTITLAEIEQRARYLALSANLGDEAKKIFRCLVSAESTRDMVRLLQDDVIHSNPGKSNEELIEIFKERQQKLGVALQKQAVEGARAALMPKLRKDAREELIDERIKLQEAKRLGIEISDDEVRSFIDDIADRNKMTYEEFAQHLKRQGVDIATMAEKFRATKAWSERLKRLKAN